MNIKEIAIKSTDFTSQWDNSNDILYEICAKYPRHDDAKLIVTKILFIGRIYAAALERRKTKNGLNNDSFYHKAASLIGNSELDMLMSNLTNEDDIEKVLYVHKYLMELFFELTNLKKRSLASKYLHFHKPEFFFLYDQRVRKSLSKFNTRRITLVNEHIGLDRKNYDDEYAKFYLKMSALKSEIERRMNKRLTNRELDTFLLKVNK